MKIDSEFEARRVNCPPCCSPYDCGDDTDGVQLLFFDRQIYLQVQEEYFVGHGDFFGHTDRNKSDAFGFNNKYFQETITYPGGGITSSTFNTLFDIYFNNIRQPPFASQTTTDNGGLKLGQPVYTYAGLKTWDDAKLEMRGIFDGGKDFSLGLHTTDVLEPFNFVGPTISYDVLEPPIPSFNEYDIVYYRYRLQFVANGPEPKFFPYFDIEYEDVFIPKEYLTYLDNLNKWNEANDKHQDWLECENETPGQCGAEPPLPGPPPTEPSNGIQWLGNRHLTFSGEQPPTEYFELTPIDVIANDGLFYRVNMKYFCYRDSKHGTKPVVIGPQYPKP